MFNEPISVMIVNQIVFIYLFAALFCIGYYQILGEHLIEQVKEKYEKHKDKSNEEIERLLKKEFKVIMLIAPIIVVVLVVKEISYMLIQSAKMLKAKEK